ncbi:bifunctional adenosylcobinamide kinase/adenosylcobinamide-phosphate guanylyltransferase [Bacillus solimangrovi]|uniref:Adenosylcobinamide kinase n=1 Tax=Bacillus solimangrovi TaxID=1305675 RepID=A0A1E5LHH4_9BACI|nr:bifunctional adenosylcobinamide kinase/adenosylcobinamide-phosphate guanylyltransferase [Bacillus solimangrovi]OEH93517.1 hypothetical protein BFG57_00555 [Bacillus solimangrovi]
MLTFVCGGVRSGKSSFAEQLIEEHSDQSQCHYIATSTITDSEMQNRIVRHKNDRVQSQINWQTWEQPKQLDLLTRHFSKDDVLLIDCLTVWLSNELFTSNIWKCEEKVATTVNKMLDVLKTLSERCKHVIIVSNDIFHSGFPDDFGSKVYVRSLGHLHQAIVRMSNLSYEVEFGSARLMKDAH